MWDSLVSRKVTTFRSGQTQESFFTRQILDGHMVSTYKLSWKILVDILITYNMISLLVYTINSYNYVLIGFNLVRHFYIHILHSFEFLLLCSKDH